MVLSSHDPNLKIYLMDEEKKTKNKSTIKNVSRVSSRKRVSAEEKAGIRADYGKLKWRDIQKKYGFTLRTIERVVADLIAKKKKN